MRVGAARLFAAIACLLWLGGCETSTNTTQLSGPMNGDLQTITTEPLPEATGSVAPITSAPIATGNAGAINKQLLGSEPSDDLNRGKVQYRAQNYGLAEKHFRRAVEAHPREGEAWVGLAASYDRLRRYDLADRAYEQAIAILGPTSEILNNQGYSYMLRGDYKMARKKLTAAQAKDPDNKFIQNNIELLEEVSRKGKSIR